MAAAGPGRPGPGDAGPSDPAATAPAATGAGAALPATAGPGLPAPTPTQAPGAAVASITDSTPPAASAGDATTLPLPETVLPGSKHGDRDSNDVTAIGDRSAAPFLHAPAPAALQDLKAALATGTAVFNGEPTPRPVFGDDGFDQAVGARLGWLADQKIGHAHIRLSPDDMGPVDVRLQLNGDKVHASFSSPHVDVRGHWKAACRACANCWANRASSWLMPMSATRRPVVTAMRRARPVAAVCPATENRRRAMAACRRRS